MSRASTAGVPTLFSGSRISAGVIGRLSAGRTAMTIADRAVADATDIPYVGRALHLDAEQIDAATVATLAQELRSSRAEVIVAVGGGGVLDAAKLAALALTSEHVLEYATTHAARSALTVLPDVEPAAVIIAVPTTVGTSSETNSVSILRTAHGHRLIIGRALRPRFAILDSSHLRSLSDGAVRQGGLEALLRIAGVSTTPMRADRAQRDAVAIARALLRAASDEVRTDTARLRIARLSAATQRTAALRSRTPYGARHWYVANEVAFGLAAPKMSATAAVIVAVWRRICAGDARWGDRESLAGFWRAAVAGTGHHPDPVEGIRGVIEAWGIDRPARPDADAVRALACATARAWGGRHPMLMGIDDADVRNILDDSFWKSESSTPAPTSTLELVRG